MPETRLDGLHVALVGDAEASLIDATVAAFAAVGAGAEHIEGSELSAMERLDICVCFARPPSGPTLIEMAQADLDAALEVALQQPRRSAMTAAKRMADGNGGTIVIVGTLDTTHAYPGRAAASIAMGGLLGLVRSMAAELASHRVRANLVVAGPLDTTEGASTVAAGDREPLLARTLQRSPMGRLGLPSEAAAAIRFVAGPDAGFMTGQTIRVDGGWASLNQTPDGMRFP